MRYMTLMAHCLANWPTYGVNALVALNALSVTCPMAGTPLGERLGVNEAGWHGPLIGFTGTSCRIMY